jgi:hypothetical protein
MRIRSVRLIEESRGGELRRIEVARCERASHFRWNLLNLLFPYLLCAVPNVTFFLIGDLGQTTNSETTLKELIEAESMLQTPSAGIVNAGVILFGIPLAI